MKITHTLDLRGLKCPEPIMEIRKTVRTLTSTDILYIIADDPATVRDIPSFCRFMEHTLLNTHLETIPYKYWIQI